jgi:hypothetical protein
VGLRVGLDTEARGKILCPCRGSNLDRPVVQPVVRLTELPGSQMVSTLFFKLKFTFLSLVYEMKNVLISHEISNTPQILVQLVFSLILFVFSECFKIPVQRKNSMLGALKL